MRTSDARRENEATIMRSLVLRGESSRRQIIADSALSKATVSRLVRDLVEDERIVEGPLTGSAVGRSTRTLGFRGADDLVCGIDVGGTATRFVLTDHRCHPVAAWRAPTPPGPTSKDLAAWLSDQVATACGAHERDLPTVTVVGVPGVVRPTGSQIRHSPNLRSIEGDQLGPELEAELGRTCLVENDSNVALIGELCAGAAVGADSAVMVTIGTGVGAGVALHGRLLTGATGLVGEIGMLPVDLDGTTLEEVVSGTAISDQATALGLPDPAPMAVLAPAATGDRAALRRRVLDALYAGCVAFVVAYEPDVIVVGGGVSPSLAGSLPDLQARLHDSLGAVAELRVSRLGDLAGALGAVAAGLGVAYERLGVSVDLADDETFRANFAALAGGGA